MRVFSLHNIPKFGCFILINDKIINNLPRWGVQPNFRWSLAAILLIGSRNVIVVQWWHGGPLSPCKVWWKSNDASQCESTKCDVFHYVCYRQDLPEGQLCGYCFYSRANLGFFRPDTLHRSRWNLAERSGPKVCYSSPNCTLIGSGVWVYGPQNLNKIGILPI